MGVSKNHGIPKSSILIGFSIINHPFWDTPIFGNTHIAQSKMGVIITLFCQGNEAIFCMRFRKGNKS